MRHPLYYSTNGEAPPATFREAILRGQAPDRGLYLPEEVPRLSREELAATFDATYPEIAFTVISKFVGEGDFAEEELREMLKDAYDFPVPIEHVGGRDHVARLDRGPTASFKDFAARALGRFTSHFMERTEGEVVVLTATSGDTGGAVADAFFGLPRVKVVVLFPEREVSERQRRQMTTLGGNVVAVAVGGKFDDCQALVKRAFADHQLASKVPLTSANSINFGRLLPQAVYYVYCWSRVARDVGEKVTFSVPSGNFGNLVGGLIASRMGLPVAKFLAAVNENDEFPRFLYSGRYEKVVPSRNCLSNAMNVGHPSNLARLVALYGGFMDEKGTIHRLPDMDALRRDVYSASVTDDETRETIKEFYEEHGKLLEPHGAVGWATLLRYKSATKVEGPCISLETADPAKFPEVVRELTGVDPPVPPKMSAQRSLPESVRHLPARYEALADLLTSLAM
ncbi:MAG: threonine synthase [Promethearchaeota archaeon]